DMKILDACDVGVLRASRTRTGLVLLWATSDISTKIMARKSSLSWVNSRIGFRKYIPIAERRKSGVPNQTKNARLAIPDARAEHTITAAQSAAASGKANEGRVEKQANRQQYTRRWGWTQVRKSLTPQRDSPQAPACMDK
ncbi:MAG: hypothetical protein ACK5XN_38205, partial [Bacteroidota bacterium]